MAEMYHHTFAMTTQCANTIPSCQAQILLELGTDLSPLPSENNMIHMYPYYESDEYLGHLTMQSCFKLFLFDMAICFGIIQFENIRSRVCIFPCKFSVF